MHMWSNQISPTFMQGW